MSVAAVNGMKYLAIGIIMAIVVLAFAIGALFLTFDPGASNGNGGSGTQSIVPDTDLGELALEAPNWNLQMSDGEFLELQTLRGSFVVIDLMQTGECIPCQTQTEHLRDLYTAYEGRLEILSLSLVLDDTVERTAEYKSENAITWRVGLDTQGAFGSYFNVRSVPTLVVIDDEGFFRLLHVGVWSRDDIEMTLAQMDE
jgi:thiol-disulfide isomerase/thioredoxin